eukprot:scaffold721_cov131-Cylindrotheca_fusiformis.AAC.32
MNHLFFEDNILMVFTDLGRLPLVNGDTVKHIVFPNLHYLQPSWDDVPLLAFLPTTEANCTTPLIP